MAVDTTTISVSGLSTSNHKWWGGVLAPNGKIYCIPNTANHILVIDPSDNSRYQIAYPPASGGNHKWQGGVLAPDGKIYGIPYYCSDILVIDPGDDTVSLYTDSGAHRPPSAGVVRGGALGADGRIYCVPEESYWYQIIDPQELDPVWYHSIPFSPGGLCGAVLAPNGRIYGIPGYGTSVIYIKPDLTVGWIDIPGAVRTIGRLNWCGSVLAPNGKIYCIPHNSESVLIIDPSNNSVDTETISGLEGDAKWAGGVLAPNGKIYCTPYAADNAMIIDPNAPTRRPSRRRRAAWMNMERPAVL